MDRATVGSTGFFARTLALGLALVLGGCGGSSEDADSAVVVEGDFPIVFAKRQVAAVGNPTDGAPFAPGGDLMWLDLSSPSAPLENLTAAYTQGEGDVSDPEISYDGTRLLFSMRRPGDATWNVYEMDLRTRALRRVIADDLVAGQGDDVDPAYLPDGRIVFSSTRQEATRAGLEKAGVEPYAYRDEYERERVIVLHVMDADGSDIRQISFNQSHDRNPSVLSTGEIMFARWDHVGGRNHFPIFFTNPDGTNIFVQYGAFSPGNSFLHPREMPDGRVMSALMPLSGTREGGALVAVDIRNFAEFDQPVPGTPEGAVGQTQLTLYQVEAGRENSPYGRYTTPYPLWDGSPRALVSWSPFRPEMEFDARLGEDVEVEGDPLYGVYMFDLEKKTLRPIALPEEGWAYTDPVAVLERPRPNVVSDKPLDATLAAENMGVLNVKSVYDTDGQDLMGRRVLVPGESLPMTLPPPDDDRREVPDLMVLKDPTLTTAAQRPARFVRVVKAVPTPPGVSRRAVGTTDFEMQQIVGYAPIEPDGSFRVKVPADTPLGVSVVDSRGRALQIHTNWLQVRPGETRTCNGCHSPRRGSALNSAPTAGNHPASTMVGALGESMAETRTRLYPEALSLAPDMLFTDVWTDPVQAGREPDPELRVTYAGLPAGVPAPVQGIINYPEHIQPLWEADRGTSTCTSCHANDNPGDPMSAGLDLRGVTSGTGRLKSYEELTVGDLVLGPDGLPIVNVQPDGDIEFEREEPLVTVGSSTGGSRASHLVEKVLETELRSRHVLTVPPTVDHSAMLNPSELRLLAEWVDLGGQYFNDPFDDADGDGRRQLSEVRGGVQGLSESVFEATVQPVLLEDCAMCHRPSGSTGTDTYYGASGNNFVLTGNLEGDFNMAVSMVADVCEPDSSYLLSRPTGSEFTNPPHPRVDDPDVEDDPDNPMADDLPALIVGSEAWLAIRDWIATGECSL